MRELWGGKCSSHPPGRSQVTVQDAIAVSAAKRHSSFLQKGKAPTARKSDWLGLPRVDSFSSIRGLTFSGNISEQLNYCPPNFHSACCLEIPSVSLSVGCIPLSAPLGDHTVHVSSKVCLHAQMMKVCHWMRPVDAIMC